MKKFAIPLYIAAGVLGILVIVYFLAYRSPSASAASGKAKSATDTTAVAAKGRLKVLVKATGSIDPEQEVEIKCKASGEVVKLPVDISNPVKKGDLLAQLDPEDEQRAVRLAEVNLAMVQAKLEQAKFTLKIAQQERETTRLRNESALASAKQKADEATAKLVRLEQLLSQKMTSQEDVDTAKSTKASALSSLMDSQAAIEDLRTLDIKIESYKEDIKIAEAQVEADKIALDDAKQGLKDTTILSPLDGVVSTRDVQVGQIIASGTSNVSGGTTVMKIADLSNIYVLVSVDESDIGRVKVGQKASISVDAFPDVKFPGEVVRIATKGTTSNSVVTFEVKVRVTSDKKHLLKPTMTANVEINAVDKEDVLLIPVAMVQQNKDRRFVLVPKPGAVAGEKGGYDESQAEARAVEVGESDGEKIEIISGLKEGETVGMSEGGAQNKWKAAEAKTTSSKNRMGGPPPL